jgi:hypothetical protein
MTIQLYANNAKTTLASPVNATQTTITVAPGTGAEFPNPSAGQAFKVTLVSITSPTTNEVCLCTSRTDDVLTVIRAQEGTSGTPFLLSDIVGNFDTAGVMDGLVQSVQLQSQYYQFSVAGGTANALTATIPSSLTSLTDGMSFVIKSSYANTGAATLNLTLGSTATGVLPILSVNTTALIGGEIPSSGYPITLSYSSTYNAWVLTNGSINLNIYALINSQTFTGTPRVPTPVFNDSSTIIPNTLWVQNQLINYAPIFSPTLTGVPAAPTASTGTNTTQLATTAFVQNSLSGQKLGLGITGEVWHDVTGSRSQGVTYTNSRSYPIQVQGNFGCNGGGQGQITIDGVGISFWQAQFNGCGGYSVNMPCIVPAGSTYSLNSMGGSARGWYELY